MKHEYMFRPKSKADIMWAMCLRCEEWSRDHNPHYDAGHIAMMAGDMARKWKTTPAGILIMWLSCQSE